MEFSVVRPKSQTPYAIVIGRRDGKIAASCSVIKSASGYYCTDLNASSKDDRQELYDYIKSSLGGELTPKTIDKSKLDPNWKRNPNDVVTLEALKRLIFEAINEKWIDQFVEDLIDDERTSFTFEEAEEIATKTKCNTAYVINRLKSLGVTYEPRGIPKRVRGFSSNSHDRWHGPGSSPTHGGASTDVISGFSGDPKDRRR